MYDQPGPFDKPEFTESKMIQDCGIKLHDGRKIGVPSLLVLIGQPRPVTQI